MKRIALLPILPLMAWLALQCQEPYSDPSLDASQRIPVVEGLLTNTQGPHVVRLYYARPYNQRDFEYISGATVRIIDDQGHVALLSEEGRGIYRTPPGALNAVSGRAYWVEVHLPGGELIRSIPAVMPDTIPIDKIIWRQSYVHTRLTRNDDGEPVIRGTRGMGVFARLLNSLPGDNFFRLTASLTVHSSEAFEQVEVVEVPHDGGVRLDTQTVMRTYHHYEHYPHVGTPVVGRVNAAIPFAPEDLTHFMYLVRDVESHYTEHELVQWIVFCHVYTLTPEAYAFYSAQNTLLEARDRFFDPIPQQIRSNLYVEGDPGRVVLGFFDVSALAKRNFSIYVRVSLGSRWYDSRMLPDSLAIREGSFLVSPIAPPDTLK